MLCLMMSCVGRFHFLGKKRLMIRCFSNPMASDVSLGECRMIISWASHVIHGRSVAVDAETHSPHEAFGEYSVFLCRFLNPIDRSSRSDRAMWRLRTTWRRGIFLRHF